MKIQKSKEIYQIFVLLFLFTVVYAPFIFLGGFVADDLANLFPIDSQLSYFQFQSNFSSGLVMTARPVSALLHGLSNYFLGSNAWQYHLVNLTLFLSSILVFYASIKRLISSDLAFLFALLALVFPCSSASTFTSIMVNSNLAGFFLTAALFASTYPWRFGVLIVSMLLTLSALSYEAFIPLFIFLPILGIFSSRFDNKNQRFIRNILALFIALSAYFLYKKYLESYLFHKGMDRVHIHSWLEFFNKIPSVYSNAYQILFKDSFAVSVNSFKNINYIDYFLGSAAFLLVTTSVLYSWSALNPIRFLRGFKSGSNPPFNDPQMGWQNYLKYLVPVFLLFLASFALYLFSSYQPNILGYSNRTLGGVRFTSSLLFALIFIFLASLIKNKYVLVAYSILISALIIFLSLSIVGQRKAWIAADLVNQKIVKDFEDVIAADSIQVGKSLTTLFIMPDSFPQEVNGVPLLGATWEVSPLLAQIYKKSEINAMAIARQNLGSLELHGNQLTIPIYWNASLENLLIFDHGDLDSNGVIIKIKTPNDFRGYMLSRGYAVDGASKPLLNTGLTMVFSRSLKTPNKYLTKGWGALEDWGVWSNGEKTQLELYLDWPVGSQLKVHARAFVIKEVPTQIVEIYINGVFLKKISLSQFSSNEFYIPLPKSSANSQRLTIEFMLPNAVSPKSLGINDDIRKLGIGLLDISVD